MARPNDSRCVLGVWSIAFMLHNLSATADRVVIVASSIGPASDDAAEWAPVPCIPPYCRFRCAARPPNAPQCDAIEQEGPVRITCEIGGIKQTFHNIIFGIPEQEMVACVPEKAFDFAHIIPGDWRTYIFGNSEYEYKRNYRESYYGYTRKKSGWDCNRHYEILASGTMPYFTDLDEAPATVMSLLPKTLIREGMQLPGVNATHIDHAVFDPDAYYSVACRTLAYTRRYLSTKAIARYVLEGMGKPHAKHILLLSSKARADYMREMLVHGMRELLGAGAVDVPALDFLYEFPGGVPPLELKTKELYGNGFSYAHRLPRIDLNRENLTARIAAREFDAVVYGCTDGGLPFIEEVLAHYDPGSIAIVNGEDWHGWTKIQNPEYSQYKLLGKAVHFVRELPNRCPGDEQPATT